MEKYNVKIERHGELTRGMLRGYGKEKYSIDSDTYMIVREKDMHELIGICIETGSKIRIVV